MPIMKPKTESDIAGIRSGKLVAVRPGPQKPDGSSQWFCRCDCGNEILIASSELLEGKRKSCGCSGRGRTPEDLTDKRFGSLTALYRLGEKRGSSYLWHCRCDCGNELDVPAICLKSGNTQSCGCRKLSKLRQRAKDLRGETFGYLTALEPTEKRFHGGVVWKCQCKCGRICEVPYNNLVTGNTRSCGCKKREKSQPPLHYVDQTCIEMINHPILRKDNTSGCTGVIRLPDGRWKAEITFRKKRHRLGVFKNIEDAIKERKKAEGILFGEYLKNRFSSADNTLTEDQREEEA